MALSEEEKTIFKNSKMMEEINERLSILKNCVSIPIQNISITIGRAIVNEDEIDKVVELITKKVEYTVTITINYIDNLIIITRI